MSLKPTKDCLDSAKGRNCVHCNGIVLSYAPETLRPLSNQGHGRWRRPFTILKPGSTSTPRTPQSMAVMLIQTETVLNMRDPDRWKWISRPRKTTLWQYVRIRWERGTATSLDWRDKDTDRRTKKKQKKLSLDQASNQFEYPDQLPSVCDIRVKSSTISRLGVWVWKTNPLDGCERVCWDSM